MSTPDATWRRACSAFPASAATSMPRSCAPAMTSGGGGPSAFAISRAGWPSATSTCLRAIEWSQPSTPSAACAPSGSGGTPSLSSVCSTKSLCPAGISWLRSVTAPSAGTWAGMTTSMPYGRPPVLLSIQSRTLSSSAGSLKRTQPSTPRPPARLTAAATCSEGVKPTMGCSMPSRSQSGVRTSRGVWGGRPPGAGRVMALRGPLCWSRICLTRSGGGMFGDVLARPAVVGLAGYGPADRFHEPDGARHLVTGELPAHMSLQRGHIRGGTGAKLDQRGHTLAEAVVGHAEDQRVEYVRMRLQRAFDLFGKDLLATGVHARVAAAEQGYRAILLDPRPVAGYRVTPAVHLREHLGGLDRVLVIAERDVPAARQLAGLPRSAYAAGFVDDDDVWSGRDRGTAPVLIVRADERDAGEAGLGRADRLGEEHAGQRLRARVLDRGREQRGRGVEGDQRGRVIVRRGQRLHQRPGHRVADDRQHVDPVPLHRGPERVRIELRHDHGRVPGEQAAQGGHHGGAVDERRGRHADQGGPLGALAGLRPLILQRLAGEEVDAAGERAPDVLVTPHDALRMPGGPAGVDDVDVVRAARAEVTCSRSGRYGLVEVSADRHARQSWRHHGVHDFGQVLIVDEGGQVAVPQVVRQFTAQVPVVDVDGDGAELDDGEQRFHGRDGVAGIEADVVAGTHSLSGQVVGQAIGLVFEFAVGELAVAADQRGPLREGVDGMLEQVGHVQCHGLKLERVTVLGKPLGPPEGGK